jgi:phenylacetate-CoA ligase
VRIRPFPPDPKIKVKTVASEPLAYQARLEAGKEAETNAMKSIARQTHRVVSQRLLLPVTRLRNWTKRAARPVLRAYEEGLRFRKQSVSWSDDRRREWVLDRLRFSLRRAYAQTAFYRERFDGVGFDPFADFSFDDFAALPTLEKDDLRLSGKALLSDAVPSEELLKDSTGGSTGVPVEIWLGPEERGWRESAGERFQQRIGVPAGTRTALLWGHHLDPVKRDGLKDRFSAFVNHQRWFDCFRLSKDHLDNYHQEFTRWRPACIMAYASALNQLAEYLSERGIVPAYPDLCLVTGAEKLLPQHKAIIEAVFQRPVHERYGSRDVGFIGYQLEPQASLDFELDWANLLVEPETGGDYSSILVTKLHADGMPMIRYRIGDLGRFPASSRSGHPTFLLNEVMGREMDRIWLRDSRWIAGAQIPHLLKDFAIQEFQFVQQPDYSIDLKVVPRQGFREESRKNILAVLRSNLDELPINFLLVDEIERTKANKWRPVISYVEHLERKAS